MCGGIKYIFPFLEQKYGTPPKCGVLSEYTDSAHTEVVDLSSRCTNHVEWMKCLIIVNDLIIINVCDCDRCGHATKQQIIGGISIIILPMPYFFLAGFHEKSPIIT